MRNTKGRIDPPDKLHRGTLSVLPIGSERKFGRFDLARAVIHCLKKQKIVLRDMDIVVVSSKYAAMAEGRCIRLDTKMRTPRGIRLSRKYQIEQGLAELILEESEEILGGIPGFALAISKGILAPNGGIDRSNVPKGYAILYSKDPRATAEKLRKRLLREVVHDFHGRRKRRDKPRLGVVLSDSRITPTRLGTIGIAVAAAGFKAVLDFRGKTDLFGNRLKVTVRAIADEIASCAQLVMGEASESAPIALVRGWNNGFEDSSNLSMIIPHDQCLYIQGLKNPFEKN